MSAVVDLTHKQAEKAAITAIEQVSHDIIKKMRPCLEAKTPEEKLMEACKLREYLHEAIESVKKTHHLTDEEMHNIIKSKANLRDAVFSACSEEKDFWTNLCNKVK